MLTIIQSMRAGGLLISLLCVSAGTAHADEHAEQPDMAGERPRIGLVLGAAVRAVRPISGC